jgi:hypothetical protein
MKKFIRNILVYGLLFFLIANVIAFLVLYGLKKSSFYKPQFIENGVLENKFDYVVLGSSTGLTTLNTKIIDSITKKKGLNISLDDSSLSSHFLMLQHFYNLNKTTKKLVLAITPWDTETKSAKLNENDYRFLPYISEDYVHAYFSELEKRNFKVLTWSKFFPILGTSYYNLELFYPSIITVFDSKKRNRFDERGNYEYPNNSGLLKENDYQETNIVFNNNYFYKIKVFCKQHNIQLIVYQSPIYNNKVIFAKTHEFKIINHSNLIMDKKMFYDNIHVNKIGSKMCSEKFSDELLGLNSTLIKF